MMKGNLAQARADVDMVLQINPEYEDIQDFSAELRRRGY
jgi:Tfp pilus assembly protein PilF